MCFSIFWQKFENSKWPPFLGRGKFFEIAKRTFLRYPGFYFIYLGFYVAFNTVQVISRRVVGRAEETSTYSSLGFCTVNCRPMASSYQFSHLRPCRESNPGLRGGRRECYHSATVAPSDTLGEENFDEIALSHTVKEIEGNLCFAIFGKNSKNSKWPPLLGRGKFLKIAKSTLLRYPMGRKF